MLVYLMWMLQFLDINPKMTKVDPTDSSLIEPSPTKSYSAISILRSFVVYLAEWAME
jgi:hypothetical protein